MGSKGIDQFMEVYTTKGKDMPNFFKICIDGCFISVFQIVTSTKNSNMIVVKVWNGSKALQISRNGLDCYTDGLMIY